MASRNDYYIRRKDLLQALGLPEKVPLGMTGEWHNVTVPTGWRRETAVTLPLVTLSARGVAKRIQVKCPRCGKQMRFCGLQQHVGTGTCKPK